MLNNDIKLSIIIPCYNEKNTLVEILERIKKIRLKDAFRAFYCILKYGIK